MEEDLKQMEGYIKFTPEEFEEKFEAIDEDVIENFKEIGFIVMHDDGSVEVNEEIAPTLKSIAEDYGKDASEHSELPEEVVNKIVSLVKKYSDQKRDINLKKPMYLSSYDSYVHAFYLFQNWIYLLDDAGNDIDPNDVEIDFLEKFINYVSNEGNLNT